MYTLWAEKPAARFGRGLTSALYGIPKGEVRLDFVDIRSLSSESPRTSSLIPSPFPFSTTSRSGSRLQRVSRVLQCLLQDHADEGWRSHKVVWRVYGGSDSLSNRVLLHPKCHDRVHDRELKVVKPRLVKEALCEA